MVIAARRSVACAEFRKAASTARRSEKRGGGALDKSGLETWEFFGRVETC